MDTDSQTEKPSSMVAPDRLAPIAPGAIPSQSSSRRKYLDGWESYFSELPQIQLMFDTRARLKILAHAYSQPNVEVGGVLLGRLKRIRNPGIGSKDIRLIHITGSIEAGSTISRVGSLNFPPESWAEINLERDRKYPNLTIVGWYHTHPGHSVFLSDHDLYIQKHFWQQWYQLALVIDTHAHYGAFFANNPGENKKPIKGEEFVWDQDLLTVFQQIGQSDAHNFERYEMTNQTPDTTVSSIFTNSGEPQSSSEREDALNITLYSLDDVEPVHFDQEHLQPSRPLEHQDEREQKNQADDKWKWINIILWIWVAVAIPILLFLIYQEFGSSILKFLMGPRR